MVAAVQLRDHRAAWEAKPALRAIYHDCYRRMAAAARPGRSLEIGGGTGNFKAFAPDVVTTDIQPADWLDAVCDAQELPFAEASFDNIVLFDVLHHIERPRLFFAEACRLLRPGGRVVMVEPAITPMSRVFYTHFHPEPVDMAADPLADGPRSADRDPFDANQAIPTLLFGRDGGADFAAAFPELRVRAVRRLSLFAYPLTGGFRSWSLIPSAIVRPLLRLEDALLPVLGPVMAFRLMVVLERR